MILATLLILLIAMVFLGVMKQRRTFKKTEHIPGPRPLPFLGNALELGTNTGELLENLEKLTKKYGGIVRIFMGSELWILLTDPKHIGHVLTITEGNHNEDLYKILLPLIGKGLISSSGANNEIYVYVLKRIKFDFASEKKWVKQRKIFNSLFSNKKLGNYVGIFNNAADILVDQLKQFIHQEYVDVTDPVFTQTLYCLCKTVMRIDITENTTYHDIVNKIADLIFNRFMSPIKMSDFLYYFTKDYWETRKYSKYIDDFIEDVIKKRKQELTMIGEESTSLLDEMFNLTGEDELTENEIRDHVKTFVFAGSDTVGVTLSFTLYELAKCPGIQDKILEEIESVLSSSLNGEITFENVHHLKYTECVLKEAMRLHGPLMFFARTLSSEMNFDGLSVPTNTLAIIFNHGLHKSEHIYPNPEKFDPDRFLPENFANLPPYAFIPFGSGARMCIGKPYIYVFIEVNARLMQGHKFAMLEAKLTLAKIVRNFELTECPGYEPKLVGIGTIKSTNGLPVKLRLRKDSTK